MLRNSEKRTFKRFCSICGQGFRKRGRITYRDLDFCEHHLKRFIRLREYGVCECVYEYECMELKKKEENNNTTNHIHTYIHTPIMKLL